MNLVKMYMIPAILLLISIFVIIFIASKINISDSKKVTFVSLSTFVVTYLQIAIVSYRYY